MLDRAKDLSLMDKAAVNAFLRRDPHFSLLFSVVRIVIEGDAFSGTAGELRFEFVGDQTVVSADTDGNGSANFQFDLDGLINLSAGNSSSDSKGWPGRASSHPVAETGEGAVHPCCPRPLRHGGAQFGTPVVGCSSSAC